MTQDKKAKSQALVKNASAMQAVQDLANIGGIRKVSADMFDGLEIEQVVTLEDGDAITGRFLGHGDGVEVNRMDAKEGEPTTQEVPTWRLEISPGRVAQLLGTTQLNRRLGSGLVEIGTIVTIARIGSGKTRAGRNVTRYLIGTPARPERAEPTGDVIDGETGEVITDSDIDTRESA